MTTIKPVTNYGLIARLAIDNGCQSVGELLVSLALARLQPAPQDVKEIYRVFAETAAETPDCENCEGTGTLDCACMGYDRRCGLCDGDGFVRCYECNGSGKAGGTP